MTTFPNFIAAVHGLTISGVTTKFDHPPKSISTADLPAQMLGDGGIDINEDLTTCIDDGFTKSIDLIIVVQFAGQDNPDPSYAAMATMVESVRTAIQTLGTNYYFSVRMGLEPINSVLAYTVRAPIELRE